MMPPALRLHSLEDTIRLGARLAAQAKAGDCYLLHGDLGAGKTELARAFIRHWCHDAALEVPSPTFQLVQTYRRAGSQEEVWHVDLYRIKDERELEELALEEAMQRGILLVEWPEHASLAFWPETARHLYLEKEEGAESRQVRFQGGQSWNDLTEVAR